MKLKFILASAAAAGLLLASCGDGNSAKGGDGMPANASTVDSVMYYFGQVRAAEYWRQAQNDTTLAAESARQAYLRGVRAGMDAVRPDDDAYNQGVLMGAQMALNLKDFSDSYEVKPNVQVMLQSLASALRDDSVANNRELQREFYGLMQQLNAQRDERLRAASAKALAEAGPKEGMTAVDSTLYGKTLKEGAGELLRAGQRVNAKVNVSTLAGEEVKMRLPEVVTVGDRYVAGPVSAALESMRTGETREFLTTASCLFGQRVRQLNLEPVQLLRFTVCTSEAAPAPEPAVQPAAVPQAGVVRPVVK